MTSAQANHVAGIVCGQAGKLPFSAGIGAHKAGLNECSGGHDDLEARVSSNVVADMKEAVAELDFRRSINEKNCIHCSMGHTTPPTLKDAEPFIVPSIRQLAPLSFDRRRFLPTLIFSDINKALVLTPASATETAGAVAPDTPAASSPVLGGN